MQLDVLTLHFSHLLRVGFYIRSCSSVFGLCWTFPVVFGSHLLSAYPDQLANPIREISLLASEKQRNCVNKCCQHKLNLVIILPHFERIELSSEEWDPTFQPISSLRSENLHQKCSWMTTLVIHPKWKETHTF